MNKEEAVTFLFSIAKEIKRSFESPVILVNKKDYAANIHKLLVDLRLSLMADAPPETIVDTVVGFHLDWLQAVRDLRGLKNNVSNTPREIFWSAIDFTVECVKNRYSYFYRYVENLQQSLSQDDRNLMQTELELIEDMQKSVLVVLEEKRKFLHIQSDQTEFNVKAEFEIEELLNWLDRLNDNLVVQLCKFVAKEDPNLLADLSATLKDIVDEVTTGLVAHSLLSVLKRDASSTSRKYMIRDQSTSHDLEIKKVRDKIRILEDRIARLQGQTSAAVMALQHKKIYLQDRLRSLENLKESILRIGEENESICDLFEGIREVHIFNHWLPINGRYRLVEELVCLWKAAIHGAGGHKSVISILSVADFKEIYDDHLGHFFIDKYGRKLYEKDNDGNLYQANEHGELVPMNDEGGHVFFYDHCGRYYIRGPNQRVYKAHSGASEYILDIQGQLLKLREVVDGVEYWFDQLGRYYLDADSRRVYREPGESEEFIHDGFGNLIPLHPAVPVHCCDDVPTRRMFTKESQYLKRAVGEALKLCLRDVTLKQPADPIAYLAGALESYWHKAVAAECHRQEELELQAERERIAEAEAAAAAELIGDRSGSRLGELSEGSSVDSHLMMYFTKPPPVEN